MQSDRKSELEPIQDPMLDERVPSLARTPLSQRLSLSIKAPFNNGPYPTSKIQKGPVLERESTDLSGEGVGLGVPVAKFAHRVFFPGKARVIERLLGHRRYTLIVDYELNLEERLAQKNGKIIQNENFYALKEWLAGLHKAISASRGLFECTSNALRRAWGLRTTFEMRPSAGRVRVAYAVDSRASVLRVSVDASRIDKAGCTELTVLNELDGRLFDRYYDDDTAVLVGKEIGTWEKVTADCATLTDSCHKIMLRLRSVTQATMYRGREVVPPRLSWAGIAYVIAPPCSRFDYDIGIREYT